MSYEHIFLLLECWLFSTAVETVILVHVVELVQALPWLQLTALKSEEEQRKERAQRLAMEKAAAAGLGFGPPPLNSSMPAKVGLGVVCSLMQHSVSFTLYS